MNRLLKNSAAIICLICLFICQSIPTRAQTNDLREINTDIEGVSGIASARLAQSTSGSAPDEGPQATVPTPPASGNGKDKKNGQIIIAPYPISNPAIGTGLQWVVGYIFQTGKPESGTPASFVGTAGMFTNNGSWGMIFGGSLHLKEDKYRVLAAAGAADINIDFYGIGQNAAARGVFVPLSISGKGFLAQPMIRISRNIYVGPRFQFRQLDAQIDFSSIDRRRLPETIDTVPPDIIDAVPRDLLGARTVALGPHLQRDTRNDQFYPTKGTYLNVGADLFLKSLGSKFTYQSYLAKFESYRSLSDRQTLAFGSIGCAAAGDRVPIYDLCLFGSRNYLRGYSTGRFQDRRMFASQLEYRLRLPKLGRFSFTQRLGVVGFGGVGWVGEKFGDFSFNDLLPAGGAGLRFQLTKKYPINFRLDFGIGKLGHTISLGVGEAF